MLVEACHHLNAVAHDIDDLSSTTTVLCRGACFDTMHHLYYSDDR